ncbi:MAG: nucleotide exchange factor GrpE [Actinomycetales bacterium]|nr:MAG: nucleotide exchange factor GrpE [Actinomycetales bacterium]
MTDPVEETPIPEGEEPSTSSGGETPAEPVEASLEDQLAERTNDLQRLAAEYKNYRVRAEREREAARSLGAEKVLSSLLTVLDDLGRAEQHGELTGGFKAVADALQNAVKSHQLEAFGAEGDEFDPNRHDAVFHAGESADVKTTTVAQVMARGYLVGDKVLRAAVVGVVDPASAPAETPADPDEAPEGPATDSGTEN